MNTPTEGIKPSEGMVERVAMELEYANSLAVNHKNHKQKWRFLALHLLSQVHALDEGTDYGDIRNALSELSGIPAMAISANQHIQKIKEAQAALSAMPDPLAVIDRLCEALSVTAAMSPSGLDKYSNDAFLAVEQFKKEWSGQ